jgi:hypothetical protein
MHRLSRRHFFHFAGATLVSLGVNSWGIKQQAERYGKVLAQSTPRKIALLVGINNYASQPLDGCLTDVELQRHLLTSRFGFNAKDIYTLTNEKATRQGILEAFEEYLIKQVKPGDVVVFHYSGHGSRVFDPDPIVIPSRQDQSGLNGTFVPVDSSLPVGYPQQGGVVKDIMGHTLFLLMSALNSENVTAVLDSCYSGAATRKFRVRARDGGKKILASPEEKSYQEQWLSRLKLSREDFVRGYRTGVAKGIVLAATNPRQTAADAWFNGFYAGAFTYLLTQYLWQEASTAESAIAHVVKQIPSEYNQTPYFDVQVGSGYEQKPFYFMPATSPMANAVITEVNGNQATLWLGGIDVGMVDEGTVFNAIEGKGRVMLQSREGLVGLATVQEAVQPGTLLRIVA